jgi:hypothetical protein
LLSGSPALQLLGWSHGDLAVKSLDQAGASSGALDPKEIKKRRLKRRRFD